MSTEQHDFELKYGGRVIEVHAFINTDQDPNKLAKNIQRVAKGPRLDAMVCMVSGYDGDNGAKVWGVVQKMVTKAAADPKSKPFSIGDADPPALDLDALDALFHLACDIAEIPDGSTVHRAQLLRDLVRKDT